MLNNNHHHHNSTSTVVAAAASFSFCGSFQRTRLKNNKANNFINKQPPLLRMVKVPNRSNAETLPVFGKETDDDKKRSGLLVLLTVPMAWGTFEPAVRYVYSVDVHPKIPAMVFSLSYYLVATIALLLANAAAAAAAMIASSPPTLLEGSRSSNHRSLKFAGVEWVWLCV
jgi:hypothetical protein